MQLDYHSAFTNSATSSYGGDGILAWQGIRIPVELTEREVGSVPVRPWGELAEWLATLVHETEGELGSLGRYMETNAEWDVCGSSLQGSSVKRGRTTSTPTRKYNGSVQLENAATTNLTYTTACLLRGCWTSRSA